MQTGIVLAVFLVLSFALMATAVTFSKRHLRRKFAVRRRLGL